MKKTCSDFFIKVQDNICQAFEELDGKRCFKQDNWTRTDITGQPGGGGRTRILFQGQVFEQACVNFSEVYGQLPAEMAEKLIGSDNQTPFFATGISVVVHPYSPMVATTHANFRYLEVGEQSWFGGGIDLTPYYLFEEDIRSYHKNIKQVCDRHNASYYPKFKRWCDEYFYLPHRNETRGIGGIFFDYLGKDQPQTLAAVWAFVKDLPACFLEAYVPLVLKRQNEKWSEKEKKFQLIRRGRYVEFNLLYDRGTRFGLTTGGRTDSILASLPPNVEWEYNFEVEPASREELLIKTLQSPREWSY